VRIDDGDVRKQGLDHAQGFGAVAGVADDLRAIELEQQPDDLSQLS